MERGRFCEYDKLAVKAAVEKYFWSSVNISKKAFAIEEADLFFGMPTSPGAK